MIAYLDTSVFARRYLPEAGSLGIRAVFRGRRKIAASRLCFVELCAAVSRACRERVIDEQQRDAVIARLPRDFAALSFVVEPRRGIYDGAARLTAKHPLRAYDAMQLASCLELKNHGAATELWAADGDLVTAARAEGLKVVVP